MEKHFPAPDRKKTFDIFGLGDYGKKKEQERVQQKNENNKRKKGSNAYGKSKYL